MGIYEIILISLGVAADAFAVSLTKGLSMKSTSIKESLIVGLWFGLFQFMMPTIGFYFSYVLKSIIFKLDHWIAFILLTYIGINMIKNINEEDSNLTNIFLLAIATSIDALTIGVVYFCGYKSYHHLLTFISMGIITFILSFLGCIIGNLSHNELGKKAKLIGGLILIFLGLKILLNHLGIL